MITQCMNCSGPVDTDPSPAPGICWKCFAKDIKVPWVERLIYGNGLVRWHCKRCTGNYDSYEQAANMRPGYHACKTRPVGREINKALIKTTVPE